MPTHSSCKKFLSILLTTFFAMASASNGQQQNSEQDFQPPARIVKLLQTYCGSCHDGEGSEGQFDLSSWLEQWRAPEVSQSSQLAVLDSIYQKTQSGEMPPDDEPQPSRAEKQILSNWIRKTFHNSGAISEWDRKLLFPEYGNYLNHEKLFDGSVSDPGWSPSRLWMKSPFVFDSLLVRGIGFRPGRYGRPPANLSKIKQPFNIEEKSGIMDFAAVRYADSATLATMIRNAEALVDQHLDGAMQELNERINGPLPKEQWPKDRKGRPVKPKFAKSLPEFRSVVLAQKSPSDSELDLATSRMYELVIERTPSDEDLKKYRVLARRCIQQAGNAEGLRMALVAIAISPEAIYRSELGSGPEDQYGRKLLSPIELAYAISFALTDQKPDPILLEAAQSDQLKTRQQVIDQVSRIWDDQTIEKPRILRFFREFFGYHNAPKVFKDSSRFQGDYRQVPQHLVADCDTLVQYIVEQDREVFKELLTTERYFVAHDGNHDLIAQQVKALRQFHDYLKDKDWQDFPYQTPAEHKKKIVSIDRMFTHANGNVVRRWMKYLTQCDRNGLTPIPMNNNRDFIKLYDLNEKSFSYPVEQPFVLDRGKRAGILMHPAWLIAHSLNLDNDPVRRGKWIRERLLADTIPELPITVDASIPESKTKTLRERFHVTRSAECWRCHVKMNPLGMPFESFDDFGKYRVVEQLHGSRQTKPADRSGFLDGTGADRLDGPVSNPVDLMNRIARSKRARQSFVRHAFRYWLGRNELLSDSKTLIDADRAYLDRGGSFRALVISLLSSDSFLYRKSIDRQVSNRPSKTDQK